MLLKKPKLSTNYFTLPKSPSFFTKKDFSSRPTDWKQDPQPATNWHKFDDKGTVECTLSPRHCKIKPGKFGFCGVRGNVNGELKTFNYGRSVQASEEKIETEAVYHYRPGARILSLGNIGCMMNCTFCHNWETSQVKYLDNKNVHYYTPDDVIKTAVENNIEVISWTYNDPVVWHEFVMDTSKLAQKRGIRTLYKSAFYIDPDAARQLTEVIDIFSISLKSMSEEFYRKITKGRLEPVLKAIEVVHQSGRHLELSQLLVTDLNDTEEQMRKTAKWVAALDPKIPLHFVRFHPAYKYTHVGRTPVEKLKRAREIAREEGIHYCYLGNVYEAGVSDTYCYHCNNKLIERFGMMVNLPGITQDGKCNKCFSPTPIVEPQFTLTRNYPQVFHSTANDKVINFEWNSEVNSIHIVAPPDLLEQAAIQVVREPSLKTEEVKIGKGLKRAIVSKAGKDEIGVSLKYDGTRNIEFLPVLDRAHFPVSRDVYATPAF